MNLKPKLLKRLEEGELGKSNPEAFLYVFNEFLLVENEISIADYFGMPEEEVFKWIGDITTNYEIRTKTSFKKNSK